MVFRKPAEPHINFIKRVVGIPGDTVVFERQRLTINGNLVPLEATDIVFEGASVFEEEFDGRSHQIRIESPSFSKWDGRWVIPQGQYFMMGDNRDNSRDSRAIGMIPEAYLVGEATFVWFHWIPWLNAPEWGRIGTKIE